jgi:hypothetical protein
MNSGRRRWDGGPAAILVLFFALPAVLFLGAWYSEYFSNMVWRPLRTVLAATALLLPALLTWWQASRTRRRRLLWSVLVLAGSALSLYLPGNLLFSGLPFSLPPQAYLVQPEALAEARALTFIAIVPVLMGVIPAVLYALAVGQIRPTGGGTSPFAVLIITLMGTVFWAGAFLIALLNPGPPPLIDNVPSSDISLEATIPPNVEPDALHESRFALLWRLRDNTPPGAVGVESEGTQMVITMPQEIQTVTNLELMTATGQVSIVDTGSTPIQIEGETPTAPPDDEVAPIVITPIITTTALVRSEHWSGIEIGQANLTRSPSDRPVLTLTLDDEGAEELSQYMEENPQNYMAILLDGTPLLATPVTNEISGNEFVVRGLEDQAARLLLYALRYGPYTVSMRIENN